MRNKIREILMENIVRCYIKDEDELIHAVEMSSWEILDLINEGVTDERPAA